MRTSGRRPWRSTAVVVFQPGLDAIVYNLAVLLWILSFFVETLIIRSGGSRSAEVRSDRGSGLLILLGVFVSISVANALARSGVAILPVTSFYFGLAMMILGMAVRFWAVASLRTFFSYTVQIKEGHRVISSGPYRFVRHPAYAGSLLTIVGVGFALQSGGAVLLLAVFFLAAFGYRIQVEERALVGSLGEEYLSYAKRVKRIIPFVF
ncbi:MAG TPA: isoprenylcysteine carboxylmethyltransferase family protein [Nitrososphaerales archaeon]|nr:isoprenylcysteine carboxylmethyltransferase family protein [Nitrososphaerales archaeon]